jgi:hypothetical protein
MKPGKKGSISNNKNQISRKKLKRDEIVKKK